jgi:toluene monooxygenase system protein E
MEARVTQRTYWHLAELGRKPTDYDIASSRLTYHGERGFETDLPLAGWYRTHLHGSALACDDWERFRDPRETTYTRYVELQRTKEAFVDGVIAAASEAGHDRRLAPAWLAAVGGLISPLRYPVHGLQMIGAYVAHMAPSGRIAIAGLLQCSSTSTRRSAATAGRAGSRARCGSRCAS